MKKPTKLSTIWSIDKSWTLFLDRDGVVNIRLIDDYVKSTSEFEFLPGVLEAIAEASNIFGHIIIVTNQQGIGKGIMTHEQLQEIHEFMLKEISDKGGNVNAIFYSPHLASEGNSMRKPGIGMAMKAKEMFPDIDFNKSIMAGDSISDMSFGRNASMKTVFINSDGIIIDNELKDKEYPDLPSFVNGV